MNKNNFLLENRDLELGFILIAVSQNRMLQKVIRNLNSVILFEQGHYNYSIL